MITSQINKLTLAILTSCALTACGGGGDSSDNAQAQQPQPNQPTQQQPTQQQPNQPQPNQPAQPQPTQPAQPVFDPLVVTTLEDIEDNTKEKNSLREAITYASKNGGTITFKDDLKGSIFLLKTVEIKEAAKPFAIKGHDAKDITLDGLNKVRLFNIEKSTVSMENLILKDGESRSSQKVGAAIAAQNTKLTLTNTDFIGNTYQSFISAGGALAAWKKSDVTVKGGTFKDNITTGSAWAGGGAISTYNDTKLTIDGTTFTNNTCDKEDGTNACPGGALSLKGIDTTIKNASFSKNKGNTGGAIFAYLRSGILSLDTVTFDGNTVKSRGGALYAYDDGKRYAMKVDNSKFKNNKGSTGGAIAGGPEKGTTITNSTFEKNVVLGTASSGGAIQLNGTVTIDKSTFNGNTAAEGSAGALTISSSNDSDQLTLTNSIFDGNSAINAGAVSLGGGKYTIKKSSFINNEATKSGGALKLGNTEKLDMTESVISKNKANRGAGIHTIGSTSVSVTNSSITGNRVSGKSARGGGIYTLNEITLTGTKISGNVANDDDPNTSNEGGGVCGIGSFVKDKLKGGTITNNTPNDICS